MGYANTPITKGRCLISILEARILTFSIFAIVLTMTFPPIGTLLCIVTTQWNAYKEKDLNSINSFIGSSLGSIHNNNTYLLGFIALGVLTRNAGVHG